MNTPTHIFVACALLSRASDNPGDKHIFKDEGHKKWPTLNWPLLNKGVIFGALLPDLYIFFFFLWAKFFTNADFQTIWGTLYWTQPWQTLSAISNSIPLITTLALIGWVRKWPLLYIIALAMLSHIALDLPFHADDAHKHFWPLTDFRFHSPLSYWDKKHYAGLVSILELTILFASALILWRRFQTKWVRVIVVLIPLFYLWRVIN